jgi:AraC family transcriptional regulator
LSKDQSNTFKSVYLKQEYIARINRVIDYIENNIERNIPLVELAQIANFSPYHFHRIFGAIVGETLNNFIQRIRVEKAAVQLITNHKKSITEIALDCGFSGSATFARVFKNTFHMNASEWRNGGYKDSKIRKAQRKDNQLKSKKGKESHISSEYIVETTFINQWRISMKSKSNIEAKVEVKEMPELHVAYVRHTGPYKNDNQLFERLFTKLFTWAGARDLLKFPETKCLSVYHDNPEITEDDKLRVSVCITVPTDTPVDGEIGAMTVSGGKYAVARFEIDGNQYEEAWNAVYGAWLPESGYQPDDRPPYELCHNNPKEHPEGKHIIDICVPVRPL